MDRIFGHGFICFIDHSHAFISDIIKPLCYVDFDNMEIQSLDGKYGHLGYCENIVIDNQSNIIYAQFSDIHAGQIGAYSYKIET
jgi:hypothetical protein